MKRILNSKLLPIICISLFFVLSILNISHIVELSLIQVTASIWVPIVLTIGIILGILITSSIGVFIKMIVEYFIKD